MVSKVYTVLCSLVALTAAVLFVTGNFPVMTAIVFGFIAFGLVFMGMMFVLPYSISHGAPIPAPAMNKAERSPAAAVPSGTFPDAGRSVSAPGSFGSKQPA